LSSILEVYMLIIIDFLKVKIKHIIGHLLPALNSLNKQVMHQFIDVLGSFNKAI